MVEYHLIVRSKEQRVLGTMRQLDDGWISRMSANLRRRRRRPSGEKGVYTTPTSAEFAGFISCPFSELRETRVPPHRLSPNLPMLHLASVRPSSTRRGDKAGAVLLFGHAYPLS